MKTGLRAGDALHLAIAHNHQIKLYTLDKLLVQITQQLNVEVGSLTMF
jgi:predicted nucleic acid-binding protein